MTESASKDGALREILDRLLSEIDEVIALIHRPLATELGDAARLTAEPGSIELDAPAA